MRLAGTANYLIALYVPLTHDPIFNPKALAVERGRVIALARLLPMPTGQTIDHYRSDELKFYRNELIDPWPIGWPCVIVFFSHDGGPPLRDITGFMNHKDFTSQLQFGPVDMRRYPRLRSQLMKEVRHRIALNPETQLLPF
jgi:hypothetical protein